MAREIHQREDMLRDARALSPRVKLRMGSGPESSEVFAGFRGEALSLYFGEDPAYHFNSAGELRRAYVDGRLIKAERGRLTALERRDSPDEVALVGGALDDAGQKELLAALMERLTVVRSALDAGDFVVQGQEPVDGDAVGRLRDWLAVHRAPTVAASPRVS